MTTWPHAVVSNHYTPEGVEPIRRREDMQRFFEGLTKAKVSRSSYMRERRSVPHEGSPTHAIFTGSESEFARQVRRLTSGLW